ncbi:MAG: crossover junction endodeoxyribonuclease RuvC [candidate division KSB1 bacterium]|nr:crossover junction endodeoxyribonuclease RuvC [candidate division KSB1 bacterium]
MTASLEKRVLAVDPGTGVVGYAVLAWREGEARILEASVLRLGRREGQAARLLALHRGLCEVIARCQPEEVAVEEAFFAKNARSALKLGEARGVVLLTAAQEGLPVFEYTPAEVKQAVVGYGGASKQQVQRMVATRLGLPSLPRPYDVADALAIALCHCQRENGSQKDLTSGQRE